MKICYMSIMSDKLSVLQRTMAGLTLIPAVRVIIHDCFPTAFSSAAMLSAGSYVGDKRPFVASESIWLTLSRFHTKAHM